MLTMKQTIRIGIGHADVIELLSGMVINRQDTETHIFNICVEDEKTEGRRILSTGVPCGAEM